MGYPDALLSGTSTGRNTFDPRGIAAAPVAIADCPRWRGDVGPAIGEVQPQVPSRAKTFKSLVKRPPTGHGSFCAGRKTPPSQVDNPAISYQVVANGGPQAQAREGHRNRTPRA